MYAGPNITATAEGLRSGLRYAFRLLAENDVSVDSVDGVECAQSECMLTGCWQRTMFGAFCFPSNRLKPRCEPNAHIRCKGMKQAALTPNPGHNC